jgi:hypothetical protein
VYDDNDIDDNGTPEWPSSFPAPLLPDFPADANGYINLFDPPGKRVLAECGDPFDPTIPTAYWITSHLLTLVLDARSAYQPPFVEARQASGADLWSVTASVPPGIPCRPDNLTRVPFQVHRQPVPSPDAPLRLTRGAVIDLNASGLNREPLRPFRLVDPNQPADPLLNPLLEPLPLDPADPRFLTVFQPRLRPVVVLFSPNGSVESVYHYQIQYDAAGNIVGGRYVQRHAAETIHFLVGKWERTSAELGGRPQSEDGRVNWQDAANLWVTLNPQTGLVTVAEPSTYYVDPVDGQLKQFIDPTTNTALPPTIDDSRRYAREAQISKGGR